MKRDPITRKNLICSLCQQKFTLRGIAAHWRAAHRRYYEHRLVRVWVVNGVATFHVANPPRHQKLTKVAR